MSKSKTQSTNKEILKNLDNDTLQENLDANENVTNKETKDSSLFKENKKSQNTKTEDNLEVNNVNVNNANQKLLKKQKALRTTKTMTFEVLTIMVGTFIMALGFQIFLMPHNIVPGGFMGLAQIIHDVLENLTGFNSIGVYYWYIILNVFLYIYAVKCLGWKFGIRAGVGIFSYAIFGMIIESTNLVAPILEMIQADTATSYILYAIYGGVLYGVGIGIVFRGNGSTGGCDMVALVVNKFFPTITTGQIIIFVDGAVVLLSVIAYGSLVLPLYALITIFISGKVSDMFVDGIRSLRAYYVVTDKKEEISNAVFEKLNRGVTNLKCEGMFTHNDRDMLLIIVRRSQIMTLKKIVKRIDENSFMFSHNIKEAYGKGFVQYSGNKKNKKLAKQFINEEKTNLKQQQVTNLKVNDKKESLKDNKETSNLINVEKDSKTKKSNKKQ